MEYFLRLFSLSLLPLIQGQLSVSDERMCTSTEDLACPGKVWLDKMVGSTKTKERRMHFKSKKS